MVEFVAENQEKKHFAAEVPPPAMQEHRGDERRPVRKWDERRQIGADAELARDDAPGEDEGLPRVLGSVDFVEKRQPVGHDQDNRDYGDSRVIVFIANGKHVSPYSLIADPRVAGPGSRVQVLKPESRVVSLSPGRKEPL